MNKMRTNKCICTPRGEYGHKFLHIVNCSLTSHLLLHIMSLVRLPRRMIYYLNPLTSTRARRCRLASVCVLEKIHLQCLLRYPHTKNTGVQAFQGSILHMHSPWEAEHEIAQVPAKVCKVNSLLSTPVMSHPGDEWACDRVGVLRPRNPKHLFWHRLNNCKWM